MNNILELFVDKVTMNHIEAGFVLCNGTQFYAAREQSSDGERVKNLPVQGGGTQRVIALFDQESNYIGLGITHHGMKTYYLTPELKDQFKDLKPRMSARNENAEPSQTALKRGWEYKDGKIVVY